MQYGDVLSPGSEVRDGGYADLEGTSLVRSPPGRTKGRAVPPTERTRPGRLRLLETSVTVYKDVVPRLQTVAPGALVLALNTGPTTRWLVPAR